MSTTQQARRSVLYGSLAGLGSFIVGYLLTYLWRGRDIEQSLEPIEAVLDLFQAEPVGTWRVVGWLFYSAHFVDTQVSATLGPVETTMYLDLIREGSGTLELLYLVPPLALLAAGFLVATVFDVDDAVDGAKSGATVTIGYFVLVVAGLVLFSYGGTRPDPVPAVLVAGLVYPVVFGAAGGALASVVRPTS